MARIAGVDLPRDKRVEIGLTYIYGIGPTLSKEILNKTGINPDVRVRDLTEDDVAKIRNALADYKTEGDLQGGKPQFSGFGVRHRLVHPSLRHGADRLPELQDL